MPALCVPWPDDKACALALVPLPRHLGTDCPTALPDTRRWATRRSSHRWRPVHPPGPGHCIPQAASVRKRARGLRLNWWKMAQPTGPAARSSVVGSSKLAWQLLPSPASEGVMLIEGWRDGSCAGCRNIDRRRASLFLTAPMGLGLPGGFAGRRQCVQSAALGCDRPGTLEASGGCRRPPVTRPETVHGRGRLARGPNETHGAQDAATLIQER
jgi:hypothetical protein